MNNHTIQLWMIYIQCLWLCRMSVKGPAPALCVSCVGVTQRHLACKWLHTHRDRRCAVKTVLYHARWNLVVHLSLSLLQHHRLHQTPLLSSRLARSPSPHGCHAVTTTSHHPTVSLVQTCLEGVDGLDPHVLVESPLAATQLPPRRLLAGRGGGEEQIWKALGEERAPVDLPGQLAGRVAYLGGAALFLAVVVVAVVVPLLVPHHPPCLAPLGGGEGSGTGASLEDGGRAPGVWLSVANDARAGRVRLPILCYNRGHDRSHVDLVPGLPATVECDCQEHQAHENCGSQEDDGGNHQCNVVRDS